MAAASVLGRREWEGGGKESVLCVWRGEERRGEERRGEERRGENKSRVHKSRKEERREQ
jgi:hypothetical protein